MLGKSLQCEAKKTIRNGDFNCENIENKNEYNKFNSNSTSRVSYFVKIPIFNLILNSFKVSFNYRDTSRNEMLSLYVLRKQVFSYSKLAFALPLIASSQLSITNRIRQNSNKTLRTLRINCYYHYSNIDCKSCKSTYSNSKLLIKISLHALLEALMPRVIISLSNLMNRTSICVTNPVNNLTPSNTNPEYTNLTNDVSINFHNTRYRVSYIYQTHNHDGAESYQGFQQQRQSLQSPQV